MALTVEDGTGLPDADSYLDLAGFAAYLAAHGRVTAALDPAREVALRRATQYLDGKYGPQFVGARRTRAQALAWPRVHARDGEGHRISPDEIPRELLDATAEAAWRALTGELEPDLAPGAASVRSESKSLGPISKSVSYAEGGPAPPRYRVIEQLLASLLLGGVGVHTLVRA